MPEVGEVKYKVVADDTGLDQQIDGTEQKLTTRFGKVAGVVGKAATGALAVGTAAVVGLTKSIVDGTKETAAYGDNIDKLSQKIGISAEAFQEWDYVFSQNGADISLLETGMKTLASAVADAGNGSDAAAKKFDQLGLSFEDLADLSQEDMFGAVIKQLQTMPEGAERTALAADLLGRSAMELGPLLNQSAEDTEELKKKAHELGMVMSDEAVSASADFTDAMDNLQRAFTGVKNGAMSDMLPAMTDITNGLADLIAGNEGAEESIVSGFETMAGSLVDMLPKIIDIFSGLVDAVITIAPKILEALGEGIIKNTPVLLPKVTQLVIDLTKMLLSMAPELIETGIQLIVDLASGLSQALPELTPAVVDAVMTIVITLLDNIDLLLDAAIQLILALAEGLIAAQDKLIEKAPELIWSLVKALIKAAPQLLQAALELILTLIRGLVQNFGKLVQTGQQVVEQVKDGFWRKVQDAKNWGRDLLSNFIGGIREKWDSLVSTVRDVAQTVRDYLGFSVPKSGPLHDFDSYAPDMMDLYAKGIDDNIDKVESSVEDVSRTVAGSFTADVGYNLPDIAGYAADLSAAITAQMSTEIVVPISIDGREVARATAWYTNEQLAWEAR